MVKVATTSLLLAAIAQANPIYNQIYKRQDVVSSASALSSEASQLVSSALGSSASVLPSSAASAASGSASASASAAPQYPGYPCPQGLLTYVDAQQAYPGVPLEAAVAFLSNWASAVPYPIVSSTGTNETGATRTYTVQGLNISEVLTNQTINNATGALSSSWNLTTPISTGGLTIYSAANHLDYYTNTTTGESSANLYSNFCSSDQAAGSVAFGQLLQGTLAAFGALLSPSGASSGASSAASSAAGPIASASSAASSGASGVVSSASGLVSSASGAVQSASSLLAQATS